MKAKRKRVFSVFILSLFLIWSIPWAWATVNKDDMDYRGDHTHTGDMTRTGNLTNTGTVTVTGALNQTGDQTVTGSLAVTDEIIPEMYLDNSAVSNYTHSLDNGNILNVDMSTGGSVHIIFLPEITSTIDGYPLSIKNYTTATTCQIIVTGCTESGSMGTYAGINDHTRTGCSFTPSTTRIIESTAGVYSGVSYVLQAGEAIVFVADYVSGGTSVWRQFRPNRFTGGVTIAGSVSLTGDLAMTGDLTQTGDQTVSGSVTVNDELITESYDCTGGSAYTVASVNTVYFKGTAGGGVTSITATLPTIAAANDGYRVLFRMVSTGVSEGIIDAAAADIETIIGTTGSTLVIVSPTGVSHFEADYVSGGTSVWRLINL